MQARKTQLAEVVRIALDEDDPRITGHEEPCCGLVLDTWTVDMNAFGFGANDDGQWRVCGACNNRGRFYKADGVTVCIRSIVGARP